MTTKAYKNQTWIPTNKGLVGLEQLKEQLVDFLVDDAEALCGVIFRGNGWLWAPTVTTAADEFSVAPNVASDLAAINGGTIIEFSALDADFTSIPIPNVLATPYIVDLMVCEQPGSVRANVRAQTVEYTSTKRLCAFRSTPSSAIDDGDGTMTFVLSNVLADGEDHTGRTVDVWMVVPHSTTAGIWLESLVVKFNGPGALANKNYVESLFAFGQAVISVIAADYRVALRGPAVSVVPWAGSTTRLGILTGAGAGNPPVFAPTGQVVFSFGWADLADVLRTDVHGETKVRVKSCAADVDEPQIDVVDAAGERVWGVDEDGDQHVGNADTPAANSSVVSFVSSGGSATQQNVAGDMTHSVSAGKKLVVTDGAGAGILEIDALAQAKGTMSLKDTNTPAAIPLSSAADTAISTELTSNLIGAINAERFQRGKSFSTHAKTMLILGGAGGPVAGNMAFSTASWIDAEGLYDAAVGDIVVCGADGQWYFYIHSTAPGTSVFAGTQTLNAVPTDAVLLGTATRAAGVMGALTPLRFEDGGYRTATAPVTVGPTLGMFPTLRSALAVVNEIMAPTAGTKWRDLEILVLESTTETSPCVVTAPGITIRGRRGATIGVAGNHNGIELNGCHDVVLRDVVLDFTGAADDGAALSRTAIEVTGNTLRALVDNVRITSSGASAWHRGIGDDGAHTISKSVFRDVLIDGASDEGVHLSLSTSTDNAFRNVVCLHSNPAAGTFQLLAGNGFRFQCNDLDVESPTSSGWVAHAFLVEGTRIRMSNVDAKLGTGSGFVTDGAVQLSVCGLHCVSNGASGVLVQNGSERIHLSNVVVDSPDDDGIVVDGSVTPCEDVSIVGFRVESVDLLTGVGIRAASSSRVHVSSGSIETAGDEGVVFSAVVRGSIRGVTMYDVGLSGGVLQSGVLLMNASSRNKVSDCDVTVAMGAITRNGVTVAAAADAYNHVHDCTFNAATVGVSDAGTGTIHYANDNT